ncbi:MAG: TonB-dependent receptor [Saprospirales bacterium]|nr:TonB-dependent receptor [Saprospirales bacterium]
MKKFFLIFFLILTYIFPGFSQTTGPKITLQRSRISVEEVLKEITRQSGAQFSYNPRAIDPKRQISFRIRNGSLENALKMLATKIPIEYSIVENQIVLNRRESGNIPIEEGPKEPEYFTVSGFVVDRASGESLIGATVFARGTPSGTSANGFGFYSLRLPKGKYTLEFSYLGFSPEVESLELVKDEKRDVRLQNIPLVLPSILVEIPTSDLLEKRQLGKLELKPKDLDNMPEFGGESGLIKSLQALPGVKTHSDGSAFFYVRGGEKDQNMIIIDDAPVYNPAHLFGFYSLVIPDFTKDIKMYKSDIPVNLGDRLSSIVDVRTRDGNLNKLEFSGALNPLINRLSLEGPLVKEKSSFFTSFRQSNFQWIYQAAFPDLELRFGDFSFKLNYKINNNNRLYFTLLNSWDILNNAGGFSLGRAGIQWNNFAMTLRWNHIFSPKLFSNTIIHTGNYQYKLSTTQDAWDSGIASLSLKSDFTNYNSSRLTTKFGVEIQGYYFNPGKILIGQLATFFPSIKQDYSRQNVWYYNADYRLGEKWRLNAGARLSIWSNLGPATYYTFDEDHELIDTVSTPSGAYKTYWNLDPRTSVQYSIDSTSSLKLSYGIYHQYIQLISNSVSPFTSFEVWLPSSPNIKPQAAQQVALGFVKYLPKQGLEFSAEGFYKKMKNQIDYADHAQTLLNPYIEGELRFGQMESYGVEFLLKKDQGRLNGWIGYTWSRTMRQTPGVNGGREYPAFQDRPHDFSLMLNYNIARRTLFSAFWTTYTGSAFSSPTGFYTFNEVTVPIYGEKNNDRLPNYRRLDIAFKFTLNKNPESRYQHSLTFSIFNVLAHKNIVAVNFNKILPNGAPVVQANAIGEHALITTQADLVRFLPSLTYKFTL